VRTPSDIEPLFRQALSMHQQGSVSRARSIYEKILAKNPAHFDACHLLGVAFMQMGSPERAADLISRALTIKPNSPDAHYNFAHVLQTLGRPDEALASIDRAISLKPVFAEYHAERGILLQALGDFSGALLCFEEALRLDHRSAESHRHKAVALVKLNRFEEALASCDASLGLSPRSAPSHSLKGKILGKLGRLEEALLCHDLAVSIDPSLAESHRQRGKILKSLNRLEEAAASYETAVRLDPHRAETFLNLAVILSDLNREEEALANCDKAIALKPELAVAHIERGYALGNINRMEEALESFERAVSLAKDGDIARVGRAWLYDRWEKWDQAKQAYEEVLVRNPANGSAWRGLAMLPSSHLTPERAQEMLDCRDASLMGEGVATRLFVKARLLMHQQRYGESFATLLEANDIRLREISQPHEWRGELDKALQYANNWNPKSGAQANGNTKSLVLVLGPSRSGKSTLEGLLKDARIKRGFEGRAAGLAKRRLGEIVIKTDTVQQSLSVQRSIVEALLASPPEETLSGEHEAITVTNPFLLSSIHMIFDLYPKSYFIFLQRNSIDNAAEVYAKDYKRIYSFAYCPREALEYVRLYKRASAVFAQKMQGRALTVAYEDLLLSPCSVMSSIYEMLGFDPPRESPPPAKARAPRSVYREHFAELCATRGIVVES
jgi:tetratricopeptide (TPR) repeat protein